MPTTRLMRFSSSGGNIETTTGKGEQKSRPLSGISSTHFLKLVEERGQIGFWTLDFTDNQMTASVGLYRLLGLDPVMPFEWNDLTRMTHPEDTSAHFTVQEVLRSGQPIHGEFRIIRPDGTVRWLQNKAEVIVAAEGQPSRAVGLMMDVTDQHEARKSVEEGWQRYKTLVSAMASTEWRATAGGDLISVTGWEQLTGQTAADSTGGGWLDAIHPDDREATRLQWLASLASEKVHAVDFRVLCADGRYRWFLARAAPMFNQDGTVREWFGAFIATGSCDASVGDPTGRSPHILEAAYIRAARALLDWTIEDLASKADVSISSVRRIEKEGGNTVRDQVHSKVRLAFEANGLSFVTGRESEIMLKLAR